VLTAHRHADAYRVHAMGRHGQQTFVTVLEVVPRPEAGHTYAQRVARLAVGFTDNLGRYKSGTVVVDHVAAIIETKPRQADGQRKLEALGFHLHVGVVLGRVAGADHSHAGTDGNPASRIHVD